jgi:flagellar basal-body rod modification protein FlgD
MTISNIQAQYGTTAAQTAKGTSKDASEMNQNDFLKLMTRQLQMQDPFNPVDNTQMVAQMAQFSSLAGINQTNATLTQIAEQIAAQTQILQDIKAATPASLETATPATPETTPNTQEG